MYFVGQTMFAFQLPGPLFFEFDIKTNAACVVKMIGMGILRGSVNDLADVHLGILLMALFDIGSLYEEADIVVDMVMGGDSSTGVISKEAAGTPGMVLAANKVSEVLSFVKSLRLGHKLI